MRYGRLRSLLNKTQTQTAHISIAAILALAGISGSLPLFLTHPVHADSTEGLITTVSGGGTVSDGSGFSCNDTISPCSHDYTPGASVTLTATPSTGFTFNGWSGGCSNASGTCSVTMDHSQGVTATFVVTTSTGPVEDVTTATYYQTIQAAVNGANSGDTIKAATGTYHENVTVDKPLVIEGANTGVAGYKSRGAESVVTGTFTVKSSGVTIDGFTISPSSGSSVTMQGSYSSETIKNNIITDNGYAVNFNTGTTYITSNQINYGAHPTTGIEANSSPGNNIHFFDNHFSGNGSSLPADITVIGGSSRTADVFVDRNSSDSGTTLVALFNVWDGTISRNTASGVQGSAIYIGGNNGYINVVGNTISQSKTAVNVANDFGDGINTHVTINKNQLPANNAAGVKVGISAYTSGAAVDATANWWGSATGPSDKVSGDGSIPTTNPDGYGSSAINAVNYSNWCTSVTCTSKSNDLPTTPFNLHFVQGTKTLSCTEDGTNLTDHGISLAWSSATTPVKYVIKPAYPNGLGQYTYYPAGSSNSVWIGDNFGKHGQGVYTYVIRADNALSQLSAPVTCSLIYDTQSPTAHFTGTVPQYVNGNFSVSGVASDNVKLKDVFFDVRDGGSWVDGCKAGTLVRNYANDQKDATPTCTIDTSHLVNGHTYTLRIHASDYGGYGGGESRQITFDNVKPTISNLKAVVNGNKTYSLTGKNTPLLVKSGDTVTVTIAVDGTGSPVDWATVRAYEQNTAAGNWHTYLFQDQSMTDNGGDGTYSYTFTVPNEYSPVPDDTSHVINENQYKNALDFNTQDKAGNTRGTELYFTIDNTAPTANISLPDGTVYGPKDNSVRVFGDVADNSNNFTYKIYLKNDDTGAVTDITPAAVYKHNFTNTEVRGLTVANFPTGNYSVYITVTDAAGNSANSNTVSFIIDKTAPSVPGNAHFVQNGSSLGTSAATNHTGSNLWLVWDDSTALSGIKGYEVIGTAPDNKQLDFTVPGNQLHRDLTGLFGIHGEGTYTFQVQAISKVGLPSGYSAMVTIVYDHSAPTGLANQSPADGASVTTANLTSIGWAAAADPSGPVVYYYESSYSNSLNPDGSFTNPAYQSTALSTNSINTPNTPEGTLYWHVRACDTLGNCTGWTSSWKVLVDDTAPVVTDNFTIKMLTSDPPKTLSPTVTGDANVTYAWSVSSNHLLVNPHELLTGPTLTIGNTPKGNYTVDLTVTDQAGNSTTKTYNVTITTPDNSNVRTTNAAVTGGNGGGNGQNGGVTPQVLGATITNTGSAGGGSNSGNSQGQVKSDQTSNSNPVNLASTNQSSKFLGLGWWWLLVVAAVLGGLYWLVSQRSGGGQDS